jgi:Rieske Fe-S protein
MFAGENQRLPSSRGLHFSILAQSGRSRRDLYPKEQSRLECPCHQGFFSIADGSVLRGPPQRALPRVVLEMNGGQLVAVRMVGEGA